MARLRADFVYLVDRLVIEPSLLGCVFPVTYGDFEVTLALPAEEQLRLDTREAPSFGLFAGDDEDSVAPSEGYVDVSAALVGGGEFAVVRSLAIRVEFESPYGEGSSTDEMMTELQRAMSAADTLVTQLVQQLCVRARHPWLALSSEVQTAVRGRLTDLEANRRLPVTRSGGSFTAYLYSTESLLSDELFENLLARVTSGEEIELHDAVLADALHFHSVRAPHSDPAAVLLGAVACEINAKATLRQVANAEAGDALELLLTTPRDFSVAAATLFSSVMEVFGGQSLAKEDNTLYRAVEELFRVRNRIAHRGDLPSPEATIECLRTARNVFRWLDDVRTNRS